MKRLMRYVCSALKGGMSARTRKKGCMVINAHGATTNTNGWSMEEVKMWGEEVRQMIQDKQARQTVTYGNRTVMLSKKEPVTADFWR